jgi:transcriptional regulator with GAF, ATPase, and Fis domain
MSIKEETVVDSPMSSPEGSASQGESENRIRPIYFYRATEKTRRTAPWFWKTYPCIEKIIEDIYFATLHSLPVLITGESGTGKELVAKAIYNMRKEKLALACHEVPWVAVNSATIPEALAESILFGHERGAFTSAREKQLGKFEIARKGTLFLDEIQNFSLSNQAKLLRVIQHRELERLGSPKSVKVECQTVIASNISLEKLVEEGRFRQDLYYRINICPIVVPPLRERTLEIESLVRDLIISINDLHNLKIENVTPEFMDLAKKYSWPGNLRELEHVLIYSALRAKKTIGTEHLSPAILAKLKKNSL